MILVGAEAEVQAGADHTELGVVVDAEEVVVLVEVDVQTFDLGRQVVGEGVLETTTHGPAVAVIREGETTGSVDQGAIEGHTGASADGAEPIVVVVLVDAERTEVVVDAAEVGVLDVAFETDHEGADLVVVANLGAAHEAAVVIAVAENRGVFEHEVAVAAVIAAVASVHTD